MINKGQKTQIQKLKKHKKHKKPQKHAKAKTKTNQASSNTKTPGRHARPDDGPVTGPKHVVYKSNKYYTRYLVVFDYSYPYIVSLKDVSE